MRSKLSVCPFTVIDVLELLLAALVLGPGVAHAQQAGNPACPGEEVFYNPGNGEDIVLPEGYRVEMFARDLNFPTGIAFQRSKGSFRVLVLQSGTGLPGACNNNEAPVFGGKFSPRNPFTPDVVIFERTGKRIAGGLFKPTPNGSGFQPDGPAIDLAFENGFEGGRLFASDSNQGVRGAPGQGNNTSRLVTLDPGFDRLNVFINRLPTGDHPTEQIAFRGGFIYWSQGSATNSGVTGLDNGAGGNQHDIPCQDIVLSNNVWASLSEGELTMTSGFSFHGVTRPGNTVAAFESAFEGLHACTGAILRARIDAPNPAATIEPFSWGYRNPFGIRFSPTNHALNGRLFVTENGEDERGARPTNNAPDRLQVAEQNPDGTPDFHGWPDMFGFLDSTQAIFNPIGGPGDDLPPALVRQLDVPVKHVLAFPPQAPKQPLALEPTDVAAVGLDFAPDSFIHGVVKQGAALVAREGDFGFSPANGEPKEGHDIQLVNFSMQGQPLQISLSRFAFNCPQAAQAHGPDGAARCEDPTIKQAFVSQLRGINRPITAMFGPDGALYLVDYGAVRDFGQSDPRAQFQNPADAPLVQIPGTGVIWKITRTK